MRSPQAQFSVFALFLISVWGEGDVWKINQYNELEQSKLLEWTDRRGGRVFVCRGTLVFFCSRVLEELPPSSPPALYPLPAAHRNECMSVGSDHHSRSYTIHQHLWICFTLIVLILAIVCHASFLSFQVHCSQELFFLFSLFGDDMEMGGWNRLKHLQRTKKEKTRDFFILKCKAAYSFWHQSSNLFVDALS